LDSIGEILFDTVASVGVLLLVWLATGRRPFNRLTAFDIWIAMAAGTVSGIGIATPDVDISRIIIALFLLGVVQFFISRTISKHYDFSKTGPVVVVENGQIINKGLKTADMPIEFLLQLLRQKGIFDITQVELALLENQGILSVLKKPEFTPLMPAHLNISGLPSRILVPVIIEGKLQEDALIKMGFTAKQIDELRCQYQDQLKDVFIAFMDNNSRQIHIVSKGDHESRQYKH